MQIKGAGEFSDFLGFTLLCIERFLDSDDSASWILLYPPLSHQMPPKRDEAALQEEEELQLAIALSQSEAEEKERMVGVTIFALRSLFTVCRKKVMHTSVCTCRGRRTPTQCIPKLIPLR